MILLSVLAPHSRHGDRTLGVRLGKIWELETGVDIILVTLLRAPTRRLVRSYKSIVSIALHQKG